MRLPILPYHPFCWLAHRLSRGIEEELLGEHRGLQSSDRATISAVARLSRIVLWVIAGIMIMQSVGVSVSGSRLSVVWGHAVGFAARDLLANFGGLSIFLDRPFVLRLIRSPDRESRAP